MRNVRMLCMLAMLMTVMVSAEALAENVTGCPLGLHKGEFWVRSFTTYMYAERALWTYEPGEKAFMVDMPEDWHTRITKTDLRLGYGITDRLDVGLLLTYFDKHLRRENYKQRPNGTWFVKRVDKEGHGFGDVWLSAKYKILKDRGPFEALAVGVGFRLDASDDCNVTKGIGSGAKAFRAVVLSHMPFGPKVDICTHLFYEWQGDRRGIDVKNDKGEMVRWAKSGQNIGDKIGYKLNVEYALNSSGTLNAHLAVIGWHKFEDRDRKDINIDRSDRYEHNLYPKFVWQPEGGEVEHRKLFIGCKIPFSYRKDFEAHFTPVIGLMWTFGGGGS